MDVTKLSQHIGEKVRAARAGLRMPRRRLAEMADVSERYLVQLESGEANVSIGVLARVANALNADIGDFITKRRMRTTSLADNGADDEFGVLVASMSGRERDEALPVLKQHLRETRRARKGIALLGLRGAGKTSIGAAFAARHGLRFLSITREIEARAGMPLADLFNLGGPDAYRTLENEVVADLSKRDGPIVLETAGGIVSNKEALDVIFGAFKTVWLKASPEEHLTRVIRQGDMRPINGAPRALDHLKSLLAERERDYERADFVLDTSHREIEDCVDSLEAIAAPLMDAESAGAPRS